VWPSGLCTPRSEGSQATKIEEHVARRKLETLEDLTLVRRERNFEASAKQPYRYHLADNALTDLEQGLQVHL
jgi:hypothetical protein